MMNQARFRGFADMTYHFFSHALGHHKELHIFLPPSLNHHPHKQYSLLILNDGQDVKAFQLEQTLERLYFSGKMQEVIVVAVRADERLREYGTAGYPDYANRGDLAMDYTKFIVKELLPYLKTTYPVLDSHGSHAIAGCSLGGLSAFDIAWNNPAVFGKAGVFSGSFWWRRHSENDEEAQIDRIMHSIVQNSRRRKGMRFWFEAGTEDEKADRNNNGIIDAIEDTLDLIDELVNKGYDRERDIRYLEVQGGQHNYHTWSHALPDFLTWAFGTK